MSFLTSDIDPPEAPSDALGRRPFAAKIAQLAADWRGERSLVIGVYGPWGSGKTTTKAMLIEHLARVEETTRPLLIDFNPWEWNGTSQLTGAFFNEIADALGTSGDAAASDAAERMSRYGRVLAVGSSIAKSLKTVGPLLLPMAGPLFSVFSDFVDQTKDVVREGAAASPARPMSKIKAELVTSLRALPRNVVVTVDDVDRLTHEEVGQLFQLIKANGDLPRMVYIIFCDRSVVERSLEKLVEGHGAEFMEKIIQLGFHLPAAMPHQIEILLLESLREVLGAHELWDEFDKSRWDAILAEGAGIYFETMRDVKRFAASLEFTLSFVAPRRRDFDVMDFVLLEILRVFEAAVYDRLILEKAVLTGRYIFPQPEGREERLQEIVKPTAARSREAVTAILRDLFPSFRRMRGAVVAVDSRTFRVSESASFDRYFVYGVPSNEVTAEELEALNAARDRRGALLPILRNGLATGRLAKWLSELEEITWKPSDITEYVVALAIFADEVPREEWGARWDAVQDIETLIWTLLREVDPISRRKAYEEMTERAFVIPCRSLLNDRQLATLLDEDVLSAGTERLSERLTQAAMDGTLAASPHLAVILMAWSEAIDDPAAAAEFARAMLDERSRPITILRAFANLSVRKVQEGSHVLRGDFTVADEPLAELVGYPLLIARVQQLAGGNLSLADRQIVDRYRYQLAARMRENET
jgi:hypothetical protein